MSAWIVSKAHVDVLVYAMARRELLEVTTDQAGAILWGENYRSVNYRYRETAETPAYAFTEPPVSWTPDQLTKILGCYEYQACESRDWEETEAHRMCADLAASLEREGANRESADADTAPWGVCDYLHDSEAVQA